VAFRDSLALSPDRPKAQFDLALAEVAQGQGAAAQAGLRQLDGAIPAADLGLALALAGDRPGGIAMLAKAVRQPDATARTRQNLALAYALDGRWDEARAMAMQDTAPDRLAGQLASWAAMAGPNAGPMQVAAMLGVSPVADPGLPTQLALAAAPDASPPMLAAAVAPASAAPDRLALAGSAAVTLIPARLPAPATPVVLASAPPPRSAPLLRAPRSASVSAPFHRAARAFVVQLGAFARDGAIGAAWDRMARRAPALAAYSPAQARFQVAGASLVRLSITGFSRREDAARLCDAVKAHGSHCFVRAVAGDAPLEWVRRDTGTQLASR
jgi:hypothetical protein